MIDDNPWENLTKPEKSYAVQRIDPEKNPNFWWGLSSNSKIGFLFEISINVEISSLIPTLKGISIEKIEPLSENMKEAIKFELQDQKDRDIFFTLCWDLFNKSKDVTGNEEEILHTILLRAARWHHLLRGGSSAKLSKEEQKGLIGELEFLDKLLGIFTPKEALRFWVAPNGAPKDFEMGSLYVEIKSRSTGSRPQISISSEDQLEIASYAELFLCVFTII